MCRNILEAYIKVGLENSYTKYQVILKIYMTISLCKITITLLHLLYHEVFAKYLRVRDYCDA